MGLLRILYNFFFRMSRDFMKNSEKKGWRRWHAEGVTDEESEFAQIKIVRTKISNCRRLVVHFWRAPKMNQKTRMGEDPHVPPAGRVLHAKRSRVLLNARGCHRVQTLLSPPQRGRRKLRGVLREEMLPRYTAFFPLRHPERSAAHARGVEWISQRFFL